MRVFKASLNFCLLLGLMSCGGGGGGSSSTTSSSSYSVVAVDGYLYRATVFLDLNGNGTYDSGEPTSTTDSSGAFTLTATSDQINSYPVIVSVIAGTTIDQDSPNTTMTSSMTMVAPAGSPSVVSPLTTQVYAKMATGLSLASAKTAVQSELGLTSVDVMKDYVSEKATNSAYSDAHKVAASIAEVLQNIDTQSSSSTTLATKLSTLATQVTSAVAPVSTQIKSAASLDAARTAVNAQINSAVNIYSIGGSISGLSGSGLKLANGTNTVSPSAGATIFTFSTLKATNGTYLATVSTNPTEQKCIITNNSGTVATQSITNIVVTCGSAYAYTVSTFAGSGSYEFANGTGSAASFKTPWGIAADSDGNLYVADTFNHQIRKITPTGVVTTFAGSTVCSNTCLSGSSDGTGTAATFTYPHGIAVDSKGNVFVAHNSSIRKITPLGVVTTFAGSTTTGNTNGTGVAATFGSSPWAIAIDSSDNLFVADISNNNIRKITPSGVVTTFAGSTLGASGSANGTGTAATFNSPSGLAFDSLGNLFVADQFNNTIRKITSAGVVTNFAGSTTSGSSDGIGTASTFYTPTGVVADSSNNLYVTDSVNKLIRKITSDGEVTTVMGATAGGNIDGIGKAARFSSPVAITKDSSGNLYIVDYGNITIRKVTITAN